MSLAHASAATLFNAKIKAFLAEYLTSPDHTGTTTFVGRQRDIAVLDDWLEHPGAASRLLLVAPAGRGKSALLAHWLTKIVTGQASINPCNRWAVAFVPVSIRFGTDRRVVYMEALAARLAEVLGERLTALGNDEEHFEEQLRGLVGLARENGKKVLIIIDGADEATGRPLDLDWFPRRSTPNLRLLVSGRLHSAQSDAPAWLVRLGWRANETITHQVEPLTRNDVVEAVSEIDGASIELGYRLYELTKGEPFLLRLYCEDLCSTNYQEKLIPSDLAARDPGFGSYFGKMLERERVALDRCGVAYDQERLDAYIAILACAQGPLSPALLNDIAAVAFGLAPVVRVENHLAPVRRFLIGARNREDSGGTGLVLSHSRLSDFIRDEYISDPAIIRRVHEAFITIAQQHATAFEKGQGGAVPVDYHLHFLSAHLDAIGARAERYLTLTEACRMKNWYASSEGASGFGRDLRHAARQIALASDVPLRDAKLMRCHLLRACTANASSLASPLAIATAREAGLISLRRAIDLATASRTGSRSTTLALLLMSAPAVDMSYLLQVTQAVSEADSFLAWCTAERLVSLPEDAWPISGECFLDLICKQWKPADILPLLSRIHSCVRADLRRRVAKCALEQALVLCQPTEHEERDALFRANGIAGHPMFGYRFPTEDDNSIPEVATAIEDEPDLLERALAAALRLPPMLPSIRALASLVTKLSEPMRSECREALLDRVAKFETGMELPGYSFSPEPKNAYEIAVNALADAPDDLRSLLAEIRRLKVSPRRQRAIAYVAAGLLRTEGATAEKIVGECLEELEDAELRNMILDVSRGSGERDSGGNTAQVSLISLTPDDDLVMHSPHLLPEMLGQVPDAWDHVLRVVDQIPALINRAHALAWLFSSASDEKRVGIYIAFAGALRETLDPLPYERLWNGGENSTLARQTAENLLRVSSEVFDLFYAEQHDLKLRLSRELSQLLQYLPQVLREILGIISEVNGPSGSATASALAKMAACASWSCRAETLELAVKVAIDAERGSSEHAGALAAVAPAIVENVDLQDEVVSSVSGFASAVLLQKLAETLHKVNVAPLAERLAQQALHLTTGQDLTSVEIADVCETALQICEHNDVVEYDIRQILQANQRKEAITAAATILRTVLHIYSWDRWNRSYQLSLNLRDPSFYRVLYQAVISEDFLAGAFCDTVRALGDECAVIEPPFSRSVALFACAVMLAMVVDDVDQQGCSSLRDFCRLACANSIENEDLDDDAAALIVSRLLPVLPEEERRSVLEALFARLERLHIRDEDWARLAVQCFNVDTDIFWRFMKMTGKRLTDCAFFLDVPDEEFRHVVLRTAVDTYNAGEFPRGHSLSAFICSGAERLVEPASLADAALTVVRGIDDAICQAEALLVLAEHLPSRRGDLLCEAESRARLEPDESRRLGFLARLVGPFKDCGMVVHAGEVVEEVCVWLMSLQDSHDLASNFRNLVPPLPDPERLCVFERVGVRDIPLSPADMLDIFSSLAAQLAKIEGQEAVDYLVRSTVEAYENF